MALQIGTGITIGGGITLTTEGAAGGGGAVTTFVVGDSNTVSIETSTGAAERIIIITNGQQSAIASWTTTATLTRSGGSGTVTFDSVMNPPIDNGNGTWTYSFYVSPTNYPGDHVWSSMALAVAGGGSSGVTYTSGTDYYPGGQFPPGLYLSGSAPTYTLNIDQAFWYSSTGFAALHGKTTGDTVTVTMPDTGSTSYTLTFTGPWQGPGSLFYATVSASPTITLGSSTPSTITIP